MKKIIVIILIFISFLTLNAEEIERIFQKDNFYCQFNTWLGTDYFAEREYKSTNYFDRHHFYAGWKYQIEEKIGLYFDLTFDDKFYEKEILLNRVGIEYMFKQFKISYKIDRLQYGEKSEIFSILVKDRFYDYGVIENYSYNGIQAAFSKEIFTARVLIAANDFNSVIADLQVQLNTSKYEAKLYYIGIGRNEEYNVRNHSLGFECDYKMGRIRIYASSVYQKLPTYVKGDKFKQLVEANYNINKFLKIGGNYFVEDFIDISKPNKQIQTFIKINLSKWENYLLYRNNLMEEFTDEFRNEEYSFLLNYKFTDDFVIGVSYNYLHPDFDQDYHQIGFQVKYHYEKDL